MTQEEIFKERLNPENIQTYHKYLRHLVVYNLVNSFSNKSFRVLDLGCGAGYGTHLLAQNNGLVVGMDISETTIEKAKNKYKKDNLIFKVADVLAPLDFDEPFDIICSLQVIEHINDDNKFLLQLKQVLKPSGIIIVSTPNKLTSYPYTEIPINPFHVREYSPNEYRILTTNVFSEVKIVGLQGSERYSKLEKFGNYESPFINFLKKIDLLSFRKIIPKQMERKLWNLIKKLKFYKTLGKSTTPIDINEGDFKIADTDLDKSFDLIAICKNSLLKK